jgi:uncharacterized protein (TIGR03083 family)
VDSIALQEAAPSVSINGRWPAKLERRLTRTVLIRHRDAMPIDLAAAYRDTYEHLVEIARGLDDDGLSAMVPASPAWTVKDVIGHLTGVAGDASHGRDFADLSLLDAWRDPEQAARRDALTAAQVEERQSLTLADVLDEWAGLVPDLVEMLGGTRPFPVPLPFLDAIVVVDLATHSQDVRGAVDRPGDRESAGVGVALAGYVAGLDLRLRTVGLPGLRLRYGPKERVAGRGEPAATLAADRYELYRALAGRRSTDQIGAMEWTGDPEPYLPLIPAYGPRQDAIQE